MIPERLGRDSEFEKAYRNHLKSLFELVDKRLITEGELGRIEIPEEPVPPEDYCAELVANGSRVSSTRPLGSSGLYSDGNYYLFEYSGKNGGTISVGFTSSGCRPAVWFTFVGALDGSGDSIKENGHIRSIFGVFSNFSVHNGDGDGPLFVDSSGHVILDLVVEP
ncbi:hypothetical protein [Thermococcus zilligii]|uniref:hypothetical protein n=1 Tax=Thermococcus zilligii TaxID=54076 RepID=UPI00029B3529|nr:hypothetical protein [Thermococcus zilligii]